VLGSSPSPILFPFSPFQRVLILWRRQPRMRIKPDRPAARVSSLPPFFFFFRTSARENLEPLLEALAAGELGSEGGSVFLFFFFRRHCWDEMVGPN